LCNTALRRKLFSNIELFWKLVGKPRPENIAPIISFAPENSAGLRRKLIAAAIYPPLIKYPGGPTDGYFRFAISSQHSHRQIAELAKVLAPYASTSLH
jgi:7-keto-8-aminopelargonate synthetase-like enzyme